MHVKYNAREKSNDSRQKEDCHLIKTTPTTIFNVLPTDSFKQHFDQDCEIIILQTRIIMVPGFSKMI